MVVNNTLDQLLVTVYAGKVVRKDLLHQIKGGDNVPSYVLEYLLGRYCASDDPEEIRLGIAAVKNTLHKNFFRHDEANKAQSLVEQHGSYRFIDRIEVRFLPSEGKYWAAMDHFNFSRIHVNERFYRLYDRLLEGGIWAIVDLEYRADEDSDQNSKAKGSPFYITELRPVQLARFDFDEFCEGRREFTTDQWMDVIIRSMGLEPAQMDRRRKLLLISRFLPFVEKNYNFIELGPRGTGKSYVFSEMSPYAILISGGKASSANLFYNNARRQVGLVGHWDVVAFDEVGGMKVQDPDTIQIMKDFMANGRFSRGVAQVLADASMVFVGNLNQSVETLVQNAATDLFQPLPKEFDLAVIDRLHFYLPGWEIPKTSRSILTTQYGFVTDYLSEAFRTLRKQNKFDALDQHFRLGSHIEGRDATAVRKTVSGLLKILHPHGAYTSEELQEYLELAIESRRRIKEQLKKRGSFEFYKTNFSYINLANSIEYSVVTPEQRSRGAIVQDALPPGTVYTVMADEESHIAIYRLEATLIPGTGKLRLPTGLERNLKESLNRAWTYLQLVHERMGLTQTLVQKDIVVEAIDLSGNRVDCACGVAFLVAILSALGQRRVLAGTVVLGDLTVQGNVKALPSITEILQAAFENGALRVLLPTANKIQFSSLPEDVIERLDIIFYSDVDRVITKAIEV